MIRFRLAILFIFCIISISSKGQTSNTIPPKKHKVAIFAPLYLDSAFNGNLYRYYKRFPRFTLPGINFVQGAIIALDSFPVQDFQIEAFFFDSKSDSINIQTLIENNNLDGIEMIIAAVKDRELILLSDFSLRKKIPLISASFPNDAGITNNPFFVILNSTLKTHCEAIFSFLLQTHTDEKIIHVRKTGTQEDRIFNYFQTINNPDKKPLLSIQSLTLDSNFYLIKNSLDSTKLNIIIAGSLDENFAEQLTKFLSTCKIKYNIKLIGMPNWEGFGAFGKKRNSTLSEFPIFYTSPYFNNKSDLFSASIKNAYLKLYKGSPTENVHKGFEAMYVFSRLLSQSQPPNFTETTLKNISVFSNYNIVPVNINNQPNHVDYLENKHLFFLKKQNGISTKGW